MAHIDYSYLRPKKAAALKRWADSPFPCRQTLELWQGDRAVILPLRKAEGLLFGLGGVVDQHGAYVPLSSIPQRVEGSYAFDEPEYRDEKVVYCGYLIDHWGHFLVEGVTRLWYFLENDPSIDKYVFFLEENAQREIRGNYREFLELLGIWDKLELITRPTAYRQVLVPERAYKTRSYYSGQYLAVFDRIADQARPAPGWQAADKVYLSRSQFQKGLAFEFGFDCLDNFFEKNGYTLLYPEKLSLSQLICYLRAARAVAMPSGSIQHNMLFARPGQRVETMERFLLNDDNQLDVVLMRQLDACYVDVNIALYPVDFAGPYMVGYVDNLQRFAADQGYQPPDARYCSRSYLKTCFQRYMKAYTDLYGYGWFMQDWYMEFTDYLYEGYQAGHALLGEYLDRRAPFRWHHYLELHYWKQLLKHILKRQPQ